MKIIQRKNNYQITIPHGVHRSERLQSIMELPQRRWDPILKVWVVPLSLQKEIGEIAEHFNASFIVDTRTNVSKYDSILEMPVLDFDPILKMGQLRPYQGHGVARGIQLKRFINGDEQGLGKTVQSISTLYFAEKQYKEETFPVLVICPSSTKINWQREWHQWTNKKAIVLRDKEKNNWHQLHGMGMADVIIVNYESLKKFFVTHYPHKSRLKNSLDIQIDPRVELFKSIIIDESHRCKDGSTQQTKITLRLAMGKKWRILLTGTPVVNRPLDLFAQLAIMGRLSQFGGIEGYKGRYCEGGNGASNLKELRWRLNNVCFFRREKKDVAKDLPEKQRQTILCDITTREAYDKAKNDFEHYLELQGWDTDAIDKKMSGEVMVKMGELKKISALGKLNEVREFAQHIIDSGEKLIIFCSLHAIVDALKSYFPKAVTVTGRDNDVQKQKHIDAFQNDPNTQLIICNIKAAGVGITLTAASRVAFVEYPWHYADCVQCEDRAHRIGQVNNVMCTYFLGQDTIDEDMYQLIVTKAEVANSITGATDRMSSNFVDQVRQIFKKAV